MIIYNVMDDGGFCVDLLFFGGKYILNCKGGEGDVNKIIIDKLVEVGGLLVCGKIKYSYLYLWWFKVLIIYCNMF